jgi:hypothetical protein
VATTELLATTTIRGGAGRKPLSLPRLLIYSGLKRVKPIPEAAREILGRDL